MYEALKHLQTGQAKVKATLADHARQLIRIREDIRSASRGRAGANGHKTTAHRNAAESHRCLTSRVEREIHAHEKNDRSEWFLH